MQILNLTGQFKMKKRDFFKIGILGAIGLAVPKRVRALEYYPNQSDKKWAVLYGTWCGSSRDAGLWISEGMNGIANVFDVRENPDLSKYDHVIVGGSIRSGQTPVQLQEFIMKNRDLLKGKIRGLYAVCGNMMQPVGPEQKSALIDNHLAKICGDINVPSKVFLGRITLGLMDPESRNMMKQMKVTEYDNLKRADCMDFGKEILTKTASGS
jgi:menaquinone-dependent protoporphyrinogen IX oxidase